MMIWKGVSQDGSLLLRVWPVRIARMIDAVIASQPSEMITYNEAFCALAILSGATPQTAKAIRNKSTLMLNTADP
jgi:hypothetical protein